MVSSELLFPPTVTPSLPQAARGRAMHLNTKPNPSPGVRSKGGYCLPSLDPGSDHVARLGGQALEVELLTTWLETLSLGFLGFTSCHSQTHFPWATCTFLVLIFAQCPSSGGTVCTNAPVSSNLNGAPTPGVPSQTTKALDTHHPPSPLVAPS